MNSSPNQFSQSSNSPEPGQPSDQAIVPSESPPTPEPKEPSSSESNPESLTDEAASNNSELLAMRQHPIRPPTEPRQYRAVGLVRGSYKPSEEQFTRGMLLTPDGSEIDAVLLGRVMSLVKNHLNLEEDHLWVVYPRTRQKQSNLHAQIMGVWEPEKLAEPLEAPPEAPVDESPTTTEDTVVAPSDRESLEPPPRDEAATPEVTDGYFSIRGEVVFQSQDQQYIVIKIKQSPRKDSEKPKFFKLQLQGTLPGKAVGHFWDLHVQRQGDILTIQDAQDMGIILTRRNKKPYQSKYPRSRRPSSPRPVRPGTKGNGQMPRARSEGTPKPVKRNKPKDEG